MELFNQEQSISNINNLLVIINKLLYNLLLQRFKTCSRP